MNAKMHNKEMSRCYLFCDFHILSELYSLGIKITLAIVYALVFFAKTKKTRVMSDKYKISLFQIVHRF